MHVIAVAVEAKYEQTMAMHKKETVKFILAASSVQKIYKRTYIHTPKK